MRTQKSLLAEGLEKKGWGVPHLVKELRAGGVQVRRQTVYRWVNGDNPPRLKHLMVLCELLELDVADFTRACSDMPVAA